MSKPDYDTTVARIAGNILSGFPNIGHDNLFGLAAEQAVKLAREIVAEVKRTQPKLGVDDRSSQTPEKP